MKNLRLSTGSQWMAIVLIMLMSISGLAPSAAAGLVPSEPVPTALNERIDNIKVIQSALETRQVQSRLQALGFSNTEIATRLERLNDAEIHQLATSIEDMQVGGEWGTVLTVTLIVFLVLLILNLTGRRRSVI